MIYLSQFKKITDVKYEVGFIHYMPFDEKHGLGKTQEELEQEGILIESIPEPQQQKGKTPTLYCNPNTKELWHEYEDVPKTQEEEQEQRIADLEIAVVSLMGGAN